MDSHVLILFLSSMYRVQAQYSVCQLFHWYIFFSYFAFPFQLQALVRIFCLLIFFSNEKSCLKITLIVRSRLLYVFRRHKWASYIYMLVYPKSFCVTECVFFFFFFSRVLLSAGPVRERKVRWHTRLWIYSHIYIHFFFSHSHSNFVFLPG